AVNRVNCQWSSDEGAPALDRGVSITVRGRKQQGFTMKSPTRKRSCQPDIVADHCRDDVQIIFLEHEWCVPLALPAQQHAAKLAFYRVAMQRACEITGYVQVERCVRAVARIAVHEGEKSNLLSFGLKPRGDCMRYKPAERPAKQIVRPNRLNRANELQILCGHLLDARRGILWSSKVARLQPVDWML